MGALTGGHLWLIAIVLVIVLIIWGPGKLPDVGSGLGRAIREFRKASSDTKDEFARATRPEEAPAPVPAATVQPAVVPVPAATTPVGPELPVQPAPVGGGTPAPAPAEHSAGEGDHTTPV